MNTVTPCHCDTVTRFPVPATPSSHHMTTLGNIDYPYNIINRTSPSCVRASGRGSLSRCHGVTVWGSRG